MIRYKDNRLEENGFVFSWAEDEGGRRPQKILSALYAFILEKI